MLKRRPIKSLDYVELKIKKNGDETAENAVVRYYSERFIDLIRNEPSDMGVGVPDYRYLHNEKITWIEVKCGNDGLQHSQLRWMYQHPSDDVIIVYVIWDDLIDD